jgi:hypothetical protein
MRAGPGLSDAISARSGVIVFATFFALVIAYGALPWTLDYVPSQDGPNHINAAAILSDIVFHRSTRNIDFYTIRPNFYTDFGVDFVGLATLPFIGPIATEKLVLCLVLVLTPTAGYLIARAAVRRPSPAILLVIPYAYTQTTVSGNYNFLLSIIVGLFIFAAIVHNDFPTSYARYAGISIGWLLTILIHPAGTVLFLYFCGVFVVARELLRSPVVGGVDYLRRTSGAVLRLLAPAIPAIAILGFFFLHSPPSDAAYRHSLYLRVREFIVQWALYKVDRVEIGFCVVFSFALFCIALAIGRYRLKLGPTLAWTDALLVVSVAALIPYLIAPNKMAGGDAFVPRISIYPLVFFVLWAACQFVPKTINAAIFVFAIVLNGAFLWSAYAFDRRASDDMRNYFRLADQIDENSVVLPVIGGTKVENGTGAPTEMQAEVFWHLHNVVAVLRHSVFLSNWDAHFPITNIMYRPGRDPYPFLEGKPLDPGMAEFEASSGEHVDYLFLWRLRAGSEQYKEATALAAKDFEPVDVSEGPDLTGLYRRRGK